MVARLNICVNAAAELNAVLRDQEFDWESDIISLKHNVVTIGFYTFSLFHYYLSVVNGETLLLSEQIHFGFVH